MIETLLLVIAASLLTLAVRAYQATKCHEEKMEKRGMEIITRIHAFVLSAEEAHNASILKMIELHKQVEDLRQQINAFKMRIK